MQQVRIQSSVEDPRTIQCIGACKILILVREEYIQVKDEDVDWMIYHLVAQKDQTTADELVTASGIAKPLVSASLDRLVQYLLIDRDGDAFHALSISEALIKCQIKNTCDSPVTIENGVIKMRKD